VKKLTEIVGWYGVVAIVGSYTLISFGLVSAQSLPYQLINLSGALAIMFEAYKKRDVQPVVLNIIWALIAVVAILRLILA